MGARACVWWLVLWRGLVGSYSRHLRVSNRVARTQSRMFLARLLQSPSSCPISIFFVWWLGDHMALRKRYRGFRIALVPTRPRS